jgi:S-formylglutathione hydrolase FrmB
MALIHAHFWSNALAKQTAFYALVPDHGRGPFPVFYLLHGLSDDHTIWLRRTRLDCYVNEMPLIVVMPDGYRSYYADHVEGPAYGKYMVEDVIGFAERTLPAIGKRSGRCIGGLSMGGYGALRLALAHPDLFVSANSHSGACYRSRMTGLLEDHELRRIFGRAKPRPDHDLEALALKIKRTGTTFPKLRIDCGTEDFLFQQNREFHAFLEKRRIAHEYAEFPGSHEWGYWDLHIREALSFHARALKLPNR